MNLVTLNNITKQYGERVLLEDVSLLINDGMRIALLGRNGSGKSTLLRIIAGEESPDQGDVTIWGQVRIRYFAQKPALNEQHTVLEAVFNSDAPDMQLLSAYQRTARSLNENPDDESVQAQLLSLSDEMDRTGGWSAEAKAKSILTKLGINTFDAPINTLSGGQKRRVALAQALIDPGNLLILDEPTNHIDADTVTWLEDYLKQINVALLMVTHDRYFLENVANQIVELNRRQLIVYPGNYTAYLEGQAEREERLAAREEKRQNLLRRELAWLRRGAQARSTKQKARKQRVMDLMQDSYDRPENNVAMALASRRLGKRVLEASNLKMGYAEEPLFEDLDFSLVKGERIGIVGPNGAGKTTFLNVLAEKIQPLEGEVSWGETVELAYFDQENAGLRPYESYTVLDFMEEITPVFYTQNGDKISPPRMLAWFLFSTTEQKSLLSSLSGGERRRLYLLSKLVHRPNVLLLDEPTNDLDVQTLNILEEFLDHFDGSLLVVSHDRYFLDRNTDFIMNIDGGVLGTRYPSPYRPEMHQQAADEHQRKAPAVKSKPAAQAKATKNKLTWKEARELESLEAEMPELETKIEVIEGEINGIGQDYQRLTMLSQQLEETNHKLEEVMERWLELSEKAD